jgi:hypothetical protein
VDWRFRRETSAQAHVRPLIRAADRWRGLRFTEFELRQIAAVRKELDQDTRLRSRCRQGQPNLAFPANPRLDQFAQPPLHAIGSTSVYSWRADDADRA